MSKREFKPSTVNELIEDLEFIRDVLDGGNLEIHLMGSGISKDGKVYGASVDICYENTHAYLVISEEYKKTYPEFIGTFYNGNFTKAD